MIDTGKGFSEQEAEKIFESFYRSQEDIHRQISGTGIGLSLTRSIILQHNGCIWTESSETEGTRFMFLLPDTEKQEEGKNESPVLSKSAEISKKFDLLVEETQNKNKQTVLLADTIRKCFNIWNNSSASIISWLRLQWQRGIGDD